MIDLTRILAGPFCTQLLADMGADVIKVETARGDPVRGQGATRDGLSWYFAQFNRNKRSIVLDLYSEAGKAALADLVAGADVLVENFRPGVLDAMGFDAARLEALNPDLVVAGVSGYGTTGPYVDRPAFDFIAQAMSGFMSINGDARGPLRAGPPLSDLVAGLYAAFGVACALAARRAGAPGQRIDSSLTGGLMSFLAYFSASYLETGEQPARTGNDHPLVAPCGLFEAADGTIAVSPSNDLYVERFLGAIGLESLLEREAFATNAARVAHRPALDALVNERTREHTVEHWIAVINGAGCPCGQVKDLAEVFDDPQVLAQEMVLDVEHPGHGTVRMTGFPVKLSATPCHLHRPAPDLGAHTEEVLRELGYDETRIRALTPPPSS